MPNVSPPRYDVDHPDSQLECEFQIEPAFLAVIDAAESAGWDPVMVARAMKSLATNYMLGREANAETDRAIQQALARRGED